MSEPLKWKVSKPTVLLYDLKPISLSCHERALWSSSASFPQSLLTTQQLFLCFALQKQAYFLIKKGWEEEGFFYQNEFWSPNFTLKGWFTCSWVRVLPQDWCHPQGDSGLLPCESVSVRASLSPLTTGGAISNQDPHQGDSVTAETQASWIAAWGLLSRLWTRCCFLGFSVALSRSTRLNRDWTQCSFFWYPGILLMSLDMKYGIKKKEKKKKVAKTSNSPLPKQVKASILCWQDLFWNAIFRMRFW